MMQQNLDVDWIFLFILNFFQPTDESDPDDGFNYRQMMARDERRFNMADENHDMKANKEEFTAFLHPEEYDHMKDIVVLVSVTFIQA